MDKFISCSECEPEVVDWLERLGIGWTSDSKAPENYWHAARNSRAHKCNCEGARLLNFEPGRRVSREAVFRRQQSTKTGKIVGVCP